MKKLLSLCLSASLLFAAGSCLTGYTVEAASNINIGDYVQMGTYNNESILWRCVDIDENGPLMLSDKIICEKAFDADTSVNTISGSHSRSTNLRTYGSNYWSDSNIRSWLNSSASAGNVQWLCGNPPSADYVDYGDPYDKEAGFLTNFTQTEINAIKEVSQKSVLPMPEIDAGITPSTGTEAHTPPYEAALPSEVLQNYDAAYAEYVSDKMFLLDLKQLNEVYNNGAILGENYWRADISLETESAYWLRSPYVGEDIGIGQNVFIVDDIFMVIRTTVADYGYYGVRPAFYLDISKAAFSNGSGTETNPYTISNMAEPMITPAPEPDNPQGVFVKLGYVQSKAGDTVDIPLTLANNMGFSNIALEVEYDSSVLTLVSVSENAGTGATYTAAQSTAANPYNMSWNSATSNNIFNGTLATLKFKISDSASVGNYPIGLSFYKGRNGDYTDGASVNYDFNHTSLGLSYVSGNVTVSDAAAGSSISVEDVQTGNPLTFMAKLRSDGQITGIAVAAVYDDSGRLIAVKQYNAASEVPFSFTDIPNAARIKVFWWDSVGGMKPLADAAQTSK